MHSYLHHIHGEGHKFSIFLLVIFAPENFNFMFAFLYECNHIWIPHQSHITLLSIKSL
jgi:hypothetical protein